MGYFDDNTQATIDQFLIDSGLPAGAFADLIDQGIRSNWSDSEFTLAIYGSPQFKAMFPGIFRPDGSMRLSPVAYRRMADNYISSARQYGVNNLSKDQIGTLIAGDVSMQEFSDRMTAIQRIDEYRPAFEEFKQVLRQQGISTKGLESDKELVDFMLGRGPEQFYKMWDQVTVGTAARTAGVGISQKLVKSIARKNPGIANEADTQAHFQNLAQSIRTVLPLSKIGKYGITKRDLVALEFGGPNQAAIAEKVNRVMSSYEGNLNRQSKVSAATREIGTISQERAQSF